MRASRMLEPLPKQTARRSARLNLFCPRPRITPARSASSCYSGRLHSRVATISAADAGSV